MSEDELTTRLNVDIPDSLNLTLNELLPHGTKSEVVRGLVRLIVRDLKRKGISAIQPLLEDTGTITAVHRMDNPKRRQTDG